MKTFDFNAKVTAAQLNEAMFKKFGTKINFENYSREQLENYRNLLRTKIHQAESSSNFNSLLSDETYQKDKYVVSVLNTKIKEMLGESKLVEGAKVDRQAGHITKSMMKKGKSKDEAEAIAWAHIKHPKKKKKAEEGIEENTMKKTNEATKKAKKDYDGDGKIESNKDEVWGSRAKAAAKSGKPFKESAKPDFLDMDKDGNKKEPMKKAIKDKKVKEETGKFDKTSTTWTDKSGKKHPAQRVTRKTDQLAGGDDDTRRPASSMKSKKTGKAMSESRAIFRQHVRIVNESLGKLLYEDEEGKAKAITAASDMVNDFTTWMQRVGQYQTKSMIELADSIRAEFGQAEAEAFKNAVAPALASTLEVMTQQRESISHAVAVLAGEAADIEPMGTDGAVDMGGGADEFGGEPIDAATDDGMNTDEFGASDAASGGLETAGREVRESREDRKARRLAEAHDLMRILSK